MAKILHNAFCHDDIDVPEAESNMDSNTSSTVSPATTAAHLQPRPKTSHSTVIPGTSHTHDFAGNERIKQVPLTPSIPRRSPTTLADDDHLRILLVEDNVINLKLLVAYMRKLNLPHSTACNGLEALNTYKDAYPNHPFNVIFMDISMPIMSGIESTTHIRRFEKETSAEPCVVIALTGAANPEARQEAFASGVDLFLTKPVPMRELKAMLDELRRGGREALVG